NILEISGAVGNENGSPLPFWIESGAVANFPNRTAVPEATFALAQGVGIATGDDPMQTDPSVLISWSDDAGVNWSVPLVRKFGRQTTIDGPVRVSKTGMTKNEARRWRLYVSDDVDVILTGG